MRLGGVQPVRFSHFYGQTDSMGGPVLAPGGAIIPGTLAGAVVHKAGTEPTQHRGGAWRRGCAEACVGDVVAVELEVVSRLPEALPLAGASLRLALLQARCFKGLLGLNNSSTRPVGVSEHAGTHV